MVLSTFTKTLPTTCCCFLALTRLQVLVQVSRTWAASATVVLNYQWVAISLTHTISKYLPALISTSTATELKNWPMVQPVYTNRNGVQPLLNQTPATTY